MSFERLKSAIWAAGDRRKAAYDRLYVAHAEGVPMGLRAADLLEKSLVGKELPERKMLEDAQSRVNEGHGITPTMLLDYRGASISYRDPVLRGGQQGHRLMSVSTGQTLLKPVDNIAAEEGHWTGIVVARTASFLNRYVAADAEDLESELGDFLPHVEQALHWGPIWINPWEELAKAESGEKSEEYLRQALQDQIFNSPDVQREKWVTDEALASVKRALETKAKEEADIMLRSQINRVFPGHHKHKIHGTEADYHRLSRAINRFSR